MEAAPTTKRNFIQRYMRGEFGNRLRTWANLDELAKSGFTGLVNLRSKTSGSNFYHGIPAGEVLGAWRWSDPPTAFHFNEAAPDDRLVLQGDVSVVIGGLMLVYDTTPGLTMRQAITDGLPQHAFKTVATALLRKHLFPTSLDDIYELLELYDGAVVEFSAYDVAVGDCRGRNAVIWEVRNY